MSVQPRATDAVDSRELEEIIRAAASAGPWSVASANRRYRRDGIERWPLVLLHLELGWDLVAPLKPTPGDREVGEERVDGRADP